MTKTQKKRAEDLVRQIEQVHEKIKEDILQNSTALAMELLTDCQSKAILLGTLIEKTEGEETVTVTMLEEYCELTYTIHENLSNKEDVHANKIYKVLRQKLIKISNSIRNDIHMRIEAVFLP